MSPSPKISLRLTPELLSALEKRAAKVGKSLGEYVREVLAKHAGIDAPEMPVGGASHDEETRRRVAYARLAGRKDRQPVKKARQKKAGQ